MIERNNSYF